MTLASSEIFVFGSNDNGWHGKGAAFVAKMQFGAIQGHSEGLQGRSYAIPTKDSKLHPKNLRAIKNSVDAFITFAIEHPELTFRVTRIGCGLAGFRDDDIAPLFNFVPPNCIMPLKWKPYFYNDELKYWNC